MTTLAADGHRRWSATFCATGLPKPPSIDGFVCPACGCMRPAALKSRAYTFECLDCGRQTSVTAGTVMHRTKLPLTTWFRAAHLMSNHSNGMSALQLKGQMDVTYKTAWLLEQKLRRSMVDPDRSKLAGIVEVDQTEVPFRTKSSFFDETTAKRIIIVGAVEIIDRSSGVTPRKKRRGQFITIHELAGSDLPSFPITRRHPSKPLCGPMSNQNRR